MSAITGISTPTAHYINHLIPPAKTTPTANQAPSSGATAPTGNDSDGDKDGSIGKNINTFA